jgi:hypothetical protein
VPNGFLELVIKVKNKLFKHKERTVKGFLELVIKVKNKLFKHKERTVKGFHSIHDP